MVVTTYVPLLMSYLSTCYPCYPHIKSEMSCPTVYKCKYMLTPVPACTSLALCPLTCHFWSILVENKMFCVKPVGVWRDTYPTRRDETRDWVHENETRWYFLTFFFCWVVALESCLCYTWQKNSLKWGDCSSRRFQTGSVFTAKIAVGQHSSQMCTAVNVITNLP